MLYGEMVVAFAGRATASPFALASRSCLVAIVRAPIRSGNFCAQSVSISSYGTLSDALPVIFRASFPTPPYNNKLVLRRVPPTRLFNMLEVKVI
jgi:hypothetical protein